MPLARLEFEEGHIIPGSSLYPRHRTQAKARIPTQTPLAAQPGGAVSQVGGGGRSAKVPAAETLVFHPEPLF